MAVEKGVNPMDNEPFTIVTGTVKKISFFEAKNNKFATHNASILVDDVYVKMSITVKEGFNPRIQYCVGKKPNEKWETLKEGDIVRMQISKETIWNDKPQYQTTSSRIFVTGHEEVTSNPTTPTPANNSPKPSSNTAGTKIYGEVKSKEKDLAMITDENTGTDHVVDLSGHKEVEVGHKMGAFVSATGQIINGFKHYPPKTSNGKKADAWGSPERNFKMAFGNMVNVASIVMTDVSDSEVFDFAQRLFKPAADLREKLLKEFKGLRDEGDVGGKLGDAFKHAAERSGDDVGLIISRAEDWFRMHILAEEEMKDLLSGKPEETSTVVEEEFDDTPPDYDDNIPF